MIKIAILGFGTVGSGVYEVLNKNCIEIAHNAAEEIEVKYIVDIRDFSGTEVESLVTKDFSAVESDPEVQIVVETIGGAKIAYDYTKRALLAGKSVITSNKELVAAHGLELISIARERNLNYLFEASVGGGIPIISPITQCLTGNELDEIYGILNGTTNFILTSMVQDGASFEDALREAQKRGYAELDPTADVEGIDAARKICILADLCFGKNVNPDSVGRKGISSVTLADVEYARRLGYKIKLLGRAYKMPLGRIAAYVAPHLISKTSLLSNVDGVMNGIVVHGNAIGECMFYGAGAGKLPTASAVVADIIDAVKHMKSRKYLGWDEAEEGYVVPASELVSRWYVRTGSGLRAIGEAFGDLRLISYPGEYPGAGPDEYAFATPAMSENELDEKLSGMDVRSKFRILD
ncbi:MAG: homoserine dehydrogenase [Oscillospiraceae bacterium]|nr:homoserine dehydrogenase [Oscillospiraceae bacterium]